MSAETSPIPEISGSATSASAQKKPQAKRIDVAPAPAEPRRPSTKEAAAWPGMPQVDMVKFFEERR